MSSNDEGTNSPFPKKRKMIQRACDGCKRKKTRCDEPKPPYNKCSNCIESDIDCTYETERKKRGRPKGYVERLEKRIKILEGLIKKLYPDQNVLYNLISPLDPEYALHLSNKSNSSSISLPSPPILSPSSLADTTSAEDLAKAESKTAKLDMIHRMVAITLGSDDDPFRADDFEHVKLAEMMQSLSVKSESNRFLGKSSGVQFMKTALIFKNECANTFPVRTKPVLQGRREIFWSRPLWERDLLQSPPVKYKFPPPDLITKLTDAYFEHVNLFYPLLHRPTFDLAVTNGFHLSDEGFGSVLLLVCAVGARYAETIDLRTLVDGVDSRLSAGWKWYSQVHVLKHHLLEPPTLFEMQSYCLAIQYNHDCHAAQELWVLVGVGIRLAQEVGLHRRRIPREKLTVEDELWKRVFWVLVAEDRMISMETGRPCTIFDDHFDLDMPIECDDEYWEHSDPNQRFRQPKGLPSTVTAFNQHLRLNRIIAFALSTIYSIKTKIWECILPEWEQHIVVELDSALNNWLNSLPDYLRWDPNLTDRRFFRLAASLITRYYHAQILIHRPYLRAKGQPLPLVLPSLAICSNAARSCSLVLEHQMKHTPVVYQYMQMIAVPTAIVLLLHMWGRKRSGITADPKALQHINVCMDVLRRAEERWRSAGIFLDVLNELTSVGEFIAPERDPGSLTESREGMSQSLLSADWSPGSFNNGNIFEEDSSSSSISDAHSSVFPTSESVYSARPHQLSSVHLNLYGTSAGYQVGLADTGSQQLYEDGSIPPYNSSYPVAFSSGGNHASISTNFNGGDQDPRSYQPRHSVQKTSMDSAIQAPTYDSLGNYPHDNQTTGRISSSRDVTSMKGSSATPQQEALVDSNTMAMWLNAPTGFEFSEWDTFITSFTEITDDLSDVYHTEGLR